MPVIITTAEPCVSQRTTMESLGFTLGAVENGETCKWFVTLETPVPAFSIRLEPQWAVTPAEALVLIIRKAYRTGSADRARAFAKLLIA